MWVCLLCIPYWGPDVASNPGMCPDWELNCGDPLVHRPVLNPLSYTSQVYALLRVVTYQKEGSEREHFQGVLTYMYKNNRQGLLKAKTFTKKVVYLEHNYPP